MSAAVMSNFYVPHWGHVHVADSQHRVQNWMFAQMAQYPPPPGPDQQHYNALYPTAAGAQQMLDPQEQLQYSSLNQPIYPKIESGVPDQASANQHMHHLAQELQQHAALDDPAHQHMQQPSQPIQHQVTPIQASSASHSSQPPTQQATPDQSQKNNRLRKACDSCSIRKVKVCMLSRDI